MEELKNTQKIPYSVTSGGLSHRRGSRPEDWVCDNVLPGEGYRTPQKAVIEKYGSMVK